MNKKKEKATKRLAANIWTKSLAKEGSVPIVHRFLESYHELEPHSLTHGEAIFVIHLLACKSVATAPRPTFKRLAQLMGITDKQARRYAQSLEAKGLLKRQYRVGEANQFDLTPLLAALEGHRQRNKDAKEAWTA
ncbi:MAG: hypothetical protein GKR89_06720 [Candidatus Latescibacteria bacterium]|nr:hypothetical protein [Candidatus Latescibacterota bacterium]